MFLYINLYSFFSGLQSGRNNCGTELHPGRVEENFPDEQTDRCSRRDPGACPGGRGPVGDGRTLPESVPETGQPSTRILLCTGGQEAGEGDRQEEPVVEAGLRQVHRRHAEEVKKVPPRGCVSAKTISSDNRVKFGLYPLSGQKHIKYRPNARQAFFPKKFSIKKSYREMPSYFKAFH